MGKSKRIRAERARAIEANPERYVRTEKSGKAKVVTAVIIAVVLAIIVGLIAVAVMQSMGVFIRMQTAMSTENYSINGTMMAYLYYTQYNYTYNMYYSYLGGQMSQEILSSIANSSKSSAVNQAEQMLVLCEAARAAGVTLDADDKAAIEESVAAIEKSAKDSRVSISAYYGNSGVNADDIRAMMEISTLASKYDEIKSEALKDAAADNTEALKEYTDKNKESFFTADYLTYTVSTKEIADSLALFKTEDEFKSQIINLTVEDKYKSEFDIAADGLAAEKLPVASLTSAIKATLVEELKYSLLEIKVEGLDLTEKKVRVDRIKAIFEKLYGDTDFEAKADEKGVTELSDELYAKIATAGDAISKTANTALKNAVKTDSAYKNDKDSTDVEKWVFDTGRVGKETKVFENKDGDKVKNYTVVLMIEPIDLDKDLTKNVGHILLKVETETVPSGATAEEKKEIEDANKAAFDKKRPDAEKILKLVEGKTKDEFEAVAKEHNEDANIFYDNIQLGDMVEKFENWCYDESRKPGDTGIVESEFGFHIMYFVGDGYENWKVDAIDGYAQEQWTEWYEAQKTAKPVTKNDNTIANVCG